MSIHGDEDRCGGFRGAEIAGRRDAVALREIEQNDIVERRRVGAKKIAAGVGGSIIYDDYFAADIDSLADRRKRFLEARTLVEHGQIDRHFRTHSAL